MSTSEWIGVDLDGTLAIYESGQWPKIGEPIPLMLARVKAWVAEGLEVRILTARAAGEELEVFDAETAIHEWLVKHGLPKLTVTCSKDFNMIELWDDRAVQVIPNTGRTIADELAAERSARAGAP